MNKNLKERPLEKIKSVCVGDNNHAISTPVIVVRDLTKTYALGKKSVYALRGVSLTIYPGEFVAIMGPSGSGKSTFMNLVGCLDTPSKGEYWLAHKLVSRLSARQLADIRNRFIGFIFQGFNLLGRANALSNVRLPMLYAGRPWREQKLRASKLLQLVGLSKHMYHKPSELSGGQQQRVAIARALTNSPTLLLADEPTGALDSTTSMEIMAVLQALNDQGLTILLVTHDSKIAECAKRQVTFLDGHIMRDEPILTPLSAQKEWEALVKKDTNKTSLESALHLEKKAQVNHSVTLATKASGQSSPLLTSYEQQSPLQNILQELHTRKGARSSVNMMVASFQGATTTLWASRTRSFLTVLGIFVGIAAVIAALIFSQGASARINAVGSNDAKTISILPIVANNGTQGNASASSLTFNDIRSLENLPDIEAISPLLNINTQIVYGNQSWYTQTQGVDESYQMIADWQVAEGSWFSTDENVQHDAVAVLGSTVAHNLFDASRDDPIGKTIRIRDQSFRVIGVLSSKGGGLGTDVDDVVYIPIGTALIRLDNTNTVDRIQVLVETTNAIDSVQPALTHTLEQNHHIIKGSDDDFYAVIPSQSLQQSQIFSNLMTGLLIGIAAISLTVGGIGVMDIMIVSVTERRREIGIRMSLGAGRYDILWQFLIEALVLCLIGGILGLFLGSLIGFVMTSSNGFSFIISPETLLLPFIVTTVIALVFGLYPAIRASRLDPIVAIRTEA